MINKELVRKARQSNGTAVSKVSGGNPKKRYYTPDGKEIWKEPWMVEWTNRTTGECGVRDKNYSFGWTDSPPENLKIECVHCKNYHDTEMEVAECGESRRKLLSRFSKEVEEEQASAREARDQREKDHERIGILEEKLDLILAKLG